MMGVRQEASHDTQTESKDQAHLPIFAQNIMEALAITEPVQEHCSSNPNVTPAPKRKRKKKKRKKGTASSKNGDNQLESESSKTTEHATNECQQVENPGVPIIQTLYGDEILCSKKKDKQKVLDVTGSTAYTVDSETTRRKDIEKAGTTTEKAYKGEETEYPNIHTIEEKKKLLILDINGVLADVVDRKPEGCKAFLFLGRNYVVRRPFCEDFLKFCFKKFHVAVWSSRTMKTLTTVVPFIFQDLQYNLLFCWSRSECTYTGYTTVEEKSKPLVLKELRKVWEYDEDDGFDETNTLLVDDSPYKSLRNPPHTAIFPYPYSCRNPRDCALGKGGEIRVYLEGMAEVETVPDYVATHPFGQKPISESNASWEFYKMIIG